MREELLKILQGDLEEARVNQICEMVDKKLEWLRRRLTGHAILKNREDADGSEPEDWTVGLEYVDARIDDLKTYLKPTCDGECNHDFCEGKQPTKSV